MAKEKQKKPTYYKAESDRWNSGVSEGRSISVKRIIQYNGEKADFKPFLTVPMKELEERLKVSKAEEKKVFDQLQEAAKAWDEHGAQSLLLQKAIEYLKVPAVTHTSNEWKKQKDGTWEISNMVYKMTFSIVKFGDEWKLSWEIQYTAPGQSQDRYNSYYDRGPKKRIDHESSKKYKTLDGAQNYVQLKFDQYASYFKAISPPVPLEAREFFSVNGQLLQGYTLKRPEVKKEEVTLSDLLNCLEEGDTIQPKAPAAPAAPAAVPPTGKVQPAKATTEPKKEAPPKAKQKSTPKKKPLHTKKKKSAPAR